MDWKNKIISRLSAGQVAIFKITSHDLDPIVPCNSEVILGPIAKTSCLQVQDIVFATLNEKSYLYQIDDKKDDFFEFRSLRGRSLGTFSKNIIHGLVILIKHSS